MTNYLLVTLLLYSTPSFSQGFFTKLFKKKNDTAKVVWDCSPDGRTKELKIKFKDKKGGLEVELSPDVNLNTSADSGACVERFKARASQALAEKKRYCKLADESIICRVDPTRLVSALESTINVSNRPVMASAKPFGESLASVGSTSVEDSRWLKALHLPSESDASQVFESKVDEVMANPSKCYDLPNATVFGENNQRVSIMARYPKVFSRALDRLQKLPEENCGELLTNYATALGQHAPEKNADFQAFCSRNPASTSCERAKKNLKLMDENLRRIVAKEFGKQGKDWMAEGAECDETPFKDLDDINSRIEKYKEELECAPMKPDESRVVYVGGKPQYAIKKVGDGYEVSMGLDFGVNPDAVKDGVSPAQMLQRVQDCMGAASNFLSPPGLPKMKINILAGSQARASEIPGHNVEIMPFNRPGKHGGTVDNPDKFRSSVSCGIIAHELMHIMGLPDDYPHGDQGGCQSLPTKPSIMGSSEGSLWDQNVPQALDCQCRKDDASCVSDQTKILTSSDQDLIRFHLQDPGITPMDKTNCESKRVDRDWAAVVEKSSLAKTQVLKSEESHLEYVVRRINPKSLKVDETTFTCKCDASNDQCKINLRSQLKTISGRIGTSSSCPSGTSAANPKPHLGPAPASGVSVTGDTFTVFTKTEHKGLILPTQVASIIGGSCPRAAAKYKACTAWSSYDDGDEKTGVPLSIRLSNTKDGGGKCSNNSNPGCVKISCANRPKFCREDETYTTFE
ncbi:MAG TPA: hypothetical protein VNJ01_06590 [Bacteriovoracaceae bacterium]|nr:hypothetical protein [Bacteriovoracaceae bacterium]